MPKKSSKQKVDRVLAVSNLFICIFAFRIYINNLITACQNTFKGILLNEPCYRRGPTESDHCGPLKYYGNYWIDCLETQFIHCSKDEN